MKVVFLPAGQGKTHRAIEFAHENNAYILAFSHTEANRIYHLAKKMGKDIKKPLVLTSHSNFQGIGDSMVVVDNADFLLAGLLREKGLFNIGMITINDPDMSKIQNPYLRGVWEDKE